jgi:hypothetical protein
VFEGDLEDRKIHIQKEKDRNGKAPIIYQLVRDYSFTNFYDEADPRDIGNRGGQAF